MGKRNCSHSTGATINVQRRNLALFLIVALLATFFAPIRSGWACPDGTACVSGEDRGFVCAGGQCATPKSCCQVKRTVRCKHGALPGQSDQERRSSGVESPDHCRFSVSVAPQLVAVTDQGGKLLTVAFDALPVLTAVELVVPAAAPAWRAEYTLGYRPPPILSTGPSRAPPVA